MDIKAQAKKWVPVAAVATVGMVGSELVTNGRSTLVRVVGAVLGASIALVAANKFGAI